MEEKPTLVIHDWDASEEAIALSRSLWKNVEVSTVRKIAVVERKDQSAAREVLAPLGFELIRAKEGSSPGSRKNAGLSSSEGDVLLMSARAEPSGPEWIGRMKEAAQSDRDVGVAGCRIVDRSGKLDGAGYHTLHPECEIYPIGGGEKNVNQYYYAREVQGVDSSCMYITEAALASAKGFDEDLGSGFEDMDFCLKVKSAGMKILCAGGMQVKLHRETATDRDPGENEASGKMQAAFRERWGGWLQERYDTRLMWHSWINDPTGYAVSSQYLVLALEDLDVDVRYGYVYGVEEPPNEDLRIMEVRRKPKDLEVTQVVYGQGDVFFKNSGKYRVGYSMLEVTGIPNNWVEQANALDEVWVPSHFNLETFESSGVERPMKVMPLGVDVNHFHPFLHSRKPGGRFVFLSVFEWGERKAPEVLLEAYNREFSAADDVVLLLKVTNNDPSVNIERQVEAMGLLKKRAPVILVLNQNIPSYQMGSLYCSSDCFVLPTRGEGWGMPTLEAMACGRPVISTNWSAQTEFFSEDVGYPVKTKRLIPAVAKCPYYAGFQWADPDSDHLASLMRYVYENREEARAMGMRASIQAREKWTWRHAAARIKERLLEISG